jgi:nicotinamide riboside kinase
VKVALIGTHGVGKTTLCFELAARLKRRGVDLEVVREVARRCPLPINQETTVSAQEWILHTQIVWEIEAAATHEVVICDRSVLDNYCYLVHAAGSSSVWERMLDHWLGSYDLLVQVPLWRRPAFDGVRAVDPSFQAEIDRVLDSMLVTRRLVPLRLDPEHRGVWGREIVEHLLPRLSPTLPLFPSDELDVDLDG